MLHRLLCTKGNILHFCAPGDWLLSETNWLVKVRVITNPEELQPQIRHLFLQTRCNKQFRRDSVVSYCGTEMTYTMGFSISNTTNKDSNSLMIDIQNHSFAFCKGFSIFSLWRIFISNFLSLSHCLHNWPHIIPTALTATVHHFQSNT